MSNIDISKTLNILEHIIEMKRCDMSLDGEIRVYIGSKLIHEIPHDYNNHNVITHQIHKADTIFGCPIEIDYDNPLCLEVHIVENVPIILSEVY